MAILNIRASMLAAFCLFTSMNKVLSQIDGNSSTPRSSLVSTITSIPTSPSTTHTSSTVIVTTAPLCSALPLILNISSDLPANSLSKIDVQCSRPITELSFMVDRLNTSRSFTIVTTQSGAQFRNNVVPKTFENGPEFRIVMVVTARNSTSQQIPITIRVVEINDPPTISNITQSIREGLDPVYSNISIPIRVTDPDSGQNNEWSNITVSSPDLPEQFVLEDDNGFRLRIVKPFDADIFAQESWEEPQSFLEEPGFETREFLPPPKNFPSSNTKLIQGPPIVRFTLVATDGGNLSAKATVNINIRDINDNAPVCQSPGTIHADTVYHPEVNAVTRLNAFCTDADYSRGNRISPNGYRVLGPQECPNVFRIQYATLQSDVRYLSSHVKACKVSIIASDPDFAATLSLDVVFSRCPASFDETGRYWNETSPGEFAYHNCPDGYKGDVDRFCDRNATFQDPIYNCVKLSIARLRQKIMQFGQPILKSIIEELANETSADKETLLNGDVGAVISSLQTVNYRLDVDATNSTDIAESYLQVANNLIAEGNTKSWKSLISTGRYGAEVVLQIVDAFAERLLRKDDTNSSEYTKSNLYLKVRRSLNCSTSIDFPDRNSSTIPLWAEKSRDHIQVPCHEEYSSYSSAIYRNVSAMLQTTLVENNSVPTSRQRVNSPVISLTLYPSTGKVLRSPVTVALEVFDRKLEAPVCSYWVFGNRPGQGHWSTTGCKLESYNRQKGLAVCKCNHLTNFAILMSPNTAVHISGADQFALSMITIVGCGISCICLVITVTVYAYFYRAVRSDRTTILLNLCVTLFIAYVVFLAGVGRTDQKRPPKNEYNAVYKTGGSLIQEDVCTAISVLLHFLYLSVFFLMLAEGADLGYRAFSPTSKYPVGRFFTIGAYVGSALIVGISAGATQLQGYGNSHSCWLSVDSGLIWAFISPALVVIVVNLVIAGGVLKQMFGLSAIKDKSIVEKAKTGARGILVMLPVMGLTWIFGVFSVSQSTVVFQYLFALFNSLQGGLLFVFHCVLNKKIQDSFKTAKKRLLQQDSESGYRTNTKKTETSQI